MRYSEDIIEEVRSRSDIVDIIGEYVKLQKKGSSYFGLCPFHHEKTPSFSVSRDKQMYYCFGCHAGGNVFNFLQEYESYTFPESVEYLAERAGIALPKVEPSAEEKRLADMKSQIMEVHRVAANYYYRQLYQPDGEKGLQYFLSRGLDLATMRKFALGFTTKKSDGLYTYMKEQGFRDEILKKTGLFTYDETKGAFDRFWNRVMFPIVSERGRVIGFGGRVMGDGEPKYLNSPETEIFNKRRNLYGISFAKRSRRKSLILCEGYMDVIALHQAGFDNAVASLGTALTEEQTKLMAKHVKDVYLIYDSDLAGTDAAVRALPMLEEVGIVGHVVQLAPYKDPDEFLRAQGAAQFEQRLKEATSGFMFQLRVKQRDYQMNTPDGKSRYVNEAVEMIVAKFEHRVDQEIYANALSIDIDVKKEDIMEKIDGTRRVAIDERTVRRRSDRREVEDSTDMAEGLLLQWIVTNPKFAKIIKQYTTPQDYGGELTAKIAKEIYPMEEIQPDYGAKRMMRCESDEERKRIAAIFQRELPELKNSTEEEKALKDTIIKVKGNSIRREFAETAEGNTKALAQEIQMKKALENLQKIRITL